MGKRIITQRRGKGSSTYKSPSHNYVSKIKHRKYNQKEKNIVYGRIMNLLHCPGHSAPLAKVKYEDGEQVFMAAPEKIAVNDIIASGSEAPVKEGNTLPLHKIPEGVPIYNIEKKPGDGGKFCRSSGTFARIATKFSNRIIVNLPSKEQKIFNPECRATIGIVAGSGRTEKPFVKAGKKFYAMKARNKLYPRTSGVSMNAVDHPFGSGRGSHIGKPTTPPRNAPPGRNIGLIHAKRTGRRKK